MLRRQVVSRRARCSPSPGSSQLATPCHWFSSEAALSALRHLHNNMRRGCEALMQSEVDGRIRAGNYDDCRILLEAGNLDVGQARPRALTSLREGYEEAYLLSRPPQNAGFCRAC